MAAAAAATGRLLLRFDPSSSANCSSKSCLGFLPKDENQMIQMKKRPDAAMIRNHRDHHHPRVKAASSLALDTSGPISSDELHVTKRSGGECFTKISLLVKDLTETTLGISKENIKDGKVLAAQTQTFIETGILNCRFFTLVAVAGSLIGSTICFVEGCVLVLQSFFQYLRTVSDHVDDGETMHLLIEAIGTRLSHLGFLPFNKMYLLGTGMLDFGFGMYVMFVGTKRLKRHSNNLAAITARSSLAVRLHRMMLSSSIQREWLSRAKSKLGQAVVMMLQAGTVEKFKNVPMVTGMDMVCFAGAILISSATLFLFSRLLLQKPVKSEDEERCSSTA